MKRILAIGGHVIKTARDELERVIEEGKVELLIHNGGSIFHDFQQSIDLNLYVKKQHSYPLSELIESPNVNAEASRLVWEWIWNSKSPEKSLTHLCDRHGVGVMMFTGLACDFWHLFSRESDWRVMAERAYHFFHVLRARFQSPFHYICMGSAVIHPEVFTKAISGIGNKDFIADVVDFLDMYRPRTRIAQYGTYHKMTHKEYFSRWLAGEL